MTLKRNRRRPRRLTSNEGQAQLSSAPHLGIVKIAEGTTLPLLLFNFFFSPFGAGQPPTSLRRNPTLGPRSQHTAEIIVLFMELLPGNRIILFGSVCWSRQICQRKPAIMSNEPVTMLEGGKAPGKPADETASHKPATPMTLLIHDADCSFRE